jgi:hypothetical protein
MWPVALPAFFTSITVPVLKLVGLVYFLVSVRLVSTGRLREHARPGQQGEAALTVEVLNRMIRTAKPVSVRTA